jgi:hypothetical protein
MCLDCVVEFESELKRLGKYEEYERNIIKKGIVVYIQELESLMLEIAMNDNNESFVTEAGDIEKWSGGNFDKQGLIEEIAEYIKTIKEAHQL